MSPDPDNATGVLVVLSGPSGVGKTSIMRGVRGRFGATFSVSATTRPPGAGEVDGVDYRFLSGDDFRHMIERDAFLEYAQVFDQDWYGTPAEPVDEALHDGRMVILDIDVQGAIQIRDRRPDAFMVFVLPPSDEELLRRLRDRGREDDRAIRRRFDTAQREIETARATDVYDLFIVNHDLDAAILETCGAIEERLARNATS